jgi:phospholipase D1/2
LEFEVKYDDIFDAELIGTVKIPAQKIATGELIASWFDILETTSKSPKSGSTLRLEMQFTPFERTPANRHDIAGDPAH